MVKERSTRDRLERADPHDYVMAASRALRDDVLTIGFARRVATYKRLELLTRDAEFARELLGGERPVQLVLPGKAHPRDEDAKRVIKALFDLKTLPVVADRVVFLDDYDLATAAALTRGCDVWLNLPRPPLEASGTSGMKSAINGGLQLSVLDGWWAEGYDGTNGWAISGEVDDDHTAQDERDTASLHALLTDEVVPAFYERDPSGAADPLARADAELAENPAGPVQRDPDGPRLRPRAVRGRRRARVTASLLERSALELAELIRSGQISAVELTTACLERIDALEPQINAFTHVAHERALGRRRADRAGGPRPFAGVPIAIKDNRAVAGMPLTMCSDIFGDYVPREDAFCVRRLRDAGFVIVGKTAMPENGILPTCESRRNGETANPWALDRTPGGSSGGAAAAVAAGCCRSRTATTAAARSGYRPRAAGSSASNLPAVACPSVPTVVRASSSAMGC